MDFVIWGFLIQNWFIVLIVVLFIILILFNVLHFVIKSAVEKGIINAYKTLHLDIQEFDNHIILNNNQDNIDNK